MKSTYGSSVSAVNILWGAALILGGGLFLAQNLGYFDQLSPQFWMAAFAGASLLFFASYFLSGGSLAAGSPLAAGSSLAAGSPLAAGSSLAAGSLLAAGTSLAAGMRHWGWLFPASISAALALTIGLSEAGFTDAAIGAPILASVGLPFVVAFALNPRQHWWALIPAWVMALLTLLVLATPRVPGETIAALVLFGIGLPFIVVYLADRSRWWALIPAFTLCAVGLIPLLANRVGGQVMGALVLLMLALPFLAVFLWSPRNWWAIIPAGILGSIGLSLLLGGIQVFGAYWDTLISAFMFLGWAATFGLLWLRRASQPTEWAKYPALVMLGIALVTMIVHPRLLGMAGSGMQQYWPLALIALGALVLLNNLRSHQSA
jgi:hypothetical protein